MSRNTVPQNVRHEHGDFSSVARSLWMERLCVDAAIPSPQSCCQTPLSEPVWQSWQPSLSVDVSLLSFFNGSGWMFMAFWHVVCICKGGGFLSLWRRGALVWCWTSKAGDSRRNDQWNVKHWRRSQWEREQQICGLMLDIRSHIVFKLRVPLKTTRAKLDHGGPRPSQDKNMASLWRVLGFTFPNGKMLWNTNHTDENKLIFTTISSRTCVFIKGILIVLGC